MLTHIHSPKPTNRVKRLIGLQAIITNSPGGLYKRGENMKQQLRRNEDYINSTPGAQVKRNWIYLVRQFFYRVQLRGRFEIYKLGVKIRLRFFLWQIKTEMRKSIQ